MPSEQVPVVQTGQVPFIALEREHADLGDELRDAFERVVKHGAFILGGEVSQFEAAWASACGTAECVGVASGTAALTTTLRAAGIADGDAVLVPAHTYIASALAVVHAGGVPVLCDVEDGTGLLDADAAAAAWTAYGRHPGRSLQRSALRHAATPAAGRPTWARPIRGRAQAHGATCEGRRAGAFGIAAAFSFYPNKNLGALGDAGAICTNDPGLAMLARRIRNLGQRRKEEHVLPGVNERLDGLQAALLRVKLGQLETANAARRRHAAAYRTMLDGRVRLLEERPSTPCVYHLFPVRVKNRDAVAARLRAAGIETGVHYSPALHRQPALGGLALASGDLPHAEAWAREELSLPMSPKLSRDEVETAAEACAAAVDLERHGNRHIEPV